MNRVENALAMYDKVLDVPNPNPTPSPNPSRIPSPIPSPNPSPSPNLQGGGRLVQMPGLGARRKG